MKTEELIESLVSDARPVRRGATPLQLGLGLTLLAVAASMLGAFALGFRPDLAAVMLERRFLMINMMLLTTLGAAALTLGFTAVPGRHRYKAQALFGAAMLVLMVGMFLMRRPWLAGMGWGLWLGLGAYCTLRTLFLGAVPALAGFWMHRHGASLHPAVSGSLIGGASGAQGANAMGWACEIDEPMHVLVWHFLLPSVLLALVGAWAGRRWLRW